MSQDNPKNVRGYEIVKELGRGGFGAVYRAYQPILKRDVALKVILPEYANQRDFIRRFEREAEIVAQLEHPFIVPLFDYWRDPDGAYLVMRYLRGGSLADKLKTASLPLEEVTKVFEQVCNALALAHRREVVHRDIKPANIMLDEEGNAYLGDFGIATSPNYEQSSEDTSGTLLYAAPEQLRGEKTTGQTDIYSLGIVLYELLTGKNPYVNFKAYEIFAKILNEPVTDIREVMPQLPYEMTEIIQKAAAKDASERYSDVREVAAALKRVGNPGISIVIEEEVELANPYKGLEAFQEYDRYEFYGRDALIEKMLWRMAHDSRFLAVVGPSGSGKSSVVKAGLIPRLRNEAVESSDDWFIIDMFPNVNPFAELETALLEIADNKPADLYTLLQGESGISRAIKQILPDGESEVLLIIDQFEEIFTLVEDETRRKAFIDNLVEAVEDPRSRLRVIITLRADFYDRPLMYGALGELIRKETEVVLPLSREELELAIVQPAANVGAYYEPALLEAILDEVHEQAGVLPLLQFALTQLFEVRKGREIKLADYQTMGMVSGVLREQAEAVYQGFSESQQQASQQLFLRLVTLGEGTEDTRRRVLQSELSGIPELETLLETWGKHRLLRFDRDALSREPTIEVAHETLIRSWERLKEWLRNNREELRIHRRLNNLAAEWKTAGQNESYLANGMRLEQFQSWAQSTQLALSDDEKRFLESSIAHEKHKREMDEARKAHEAKIAQRAENFQRASVILGVVSGIAVLATIAAIFSYLGANNEVFTVRETVIPSTMNAVATDVESAERYSASLRLASRAEAIYHDGNAGLGLALVYEAGGIDDAPQTGRILRELAYLPNPMMIRDLETGHIVYNMLISDDGSFYVTAAENGSVIIWDMQSGEELAHFQNGTGQARGLALSPDGQLLAYGVCVDIVDNQCVAAKIDIIRLQDYSVLLSINAASNEISALDFSPDGQRLLSASFDGLMQVWDVANGELLQSFEHEGVLWDASFSADGTRAVSSGARIILWNLETGEAELSLTGHRGAIHAVKFSADEMRLYSAADDGNIMVWDAVSGNLLQVLSAHTASIIDLEINGNQALSSSENGEIILWDLTDGSNISLRSYMRHSWTVGFLPGGEQALSVGVNGTTVEGLYSSVIQWDLQRGDLLSRFTGHTEKVRDLDFSPDGSRMLSVSDDATIIIWDTSNFTPIMTLQHSEAARHALFSADGSRILSASEDDSIILWDSESGENLRTFMGHSDNVMNVAWHPDGRRFISGSKDKTIILWDIESGEILHQYEGHTDTVRALLFLGAGERFLSASYDGTILLWDTESGEILRTYSGHSEYIINMALSSDESLLLSASQDNSVILWDVETGAIIRRFFGHDNLVSDVAFSPDESSFVSSSWDGRLLLWDLASGEQIYSYQGHSAYVSAVNLIPNSENMISVDESGEFIVWRLQNTAELRDWMAANRAIRDLSCSEQVEFSLLETNTGCE